MNEEIKLTEDEKILLRNIEICTRIGRNDSNDLYVWKGESGILPIFIDDLYGSKFKFIKPRRRI